MSTYGDDLDQLNRAVAHLLATGPRQAELKKTAKVLAARDMVWRGLQSATLAVTQMPGHEVIATGAAPPEAWLASSALRLVACRHRCQTR